MSTEVALNISELDLDQPDVVHGLIDYIFQETLDALCEEEQTSGLERQTDLLEAMNAILQNDVDDLPLMDETYPDRLAKRLKAALHQVQGLDEYLEVIKNEREYIYVALWLIIKDFLELLMVSADENDTEEVLALRREALANTWVKRFCDGK